jgi:hypothetical protein
MNISTPIFGCFHLEHQRMATFKPPKGTSTIWADQREDSFGLSDGESFSYAAHVVQRLNFQVQSMVSD